jgi:hypothetical protein
MYVKDKGTKKLKQVSQKETTEREERKLDKRQEERMTLGKIGFRQLGQMSIRKRTKCIL